MNNLPLYDPILPDDTNDVYSSAQGSGSPSLLPRLESRRRQDLSRNVFMSSARDGVLNEWLSGQLVVQSKKPLAFTERELKCTLRSIGPNNEVLNGSEMSDLVHYFEQTPIGMLAEFNAEFTRKLVSFFVRDVLAKASSEGHLPSGFPYLGNGFNEYSTLIKSDKYNISRLAHGREADFLAQILSRYKYGNLSFIGPGDGAEVHTTFDVMKRRDPELLTNLDSITLVDQAMIGLNQVVDSIEKREDISFDKLKLFCRVGSFGDLFLPSDHTHYIKPLLNVFIGFTSGNLALDELFTIVNNFSIENSHKGDQDAAHVLIDTGTYKFEHELDRIIDKYRGDLNRNFLLCNLLEVFKALKVDDRLIGQVRDSFTVRKHVDESMESSISLQSICSIPDDVNAVLERSFELSLPKKLVLMDSWRRKIGPFLGAFEDNDFTALNFACYDQDPYTRSMSALITKRQ